MHVARPIGATGPERYEARLLVIVLARTYAVGRSPIASWRRSRTSMWQRHTFGPASFPAGAGATPGQRTYSRARPPGGLAASGVPAAQGVPATVTSPIAARGSVGWAGCVT